ncbi:MAG TPA: hypothetical protein VHJ78_10055 [Actinomycetota bacterium]|nr:hypothetical protein [Actinomycetota bacterium]
MRGLFNNCRTGVAIALVLLAACSGGSESASSDARPQRGAAMVAAAQPALCEAETVLSAEPADSAEPLTAMELQARLIVDTAPKPEGFRSQTVIVDQGLGSFRIATPTTFSAFWRNGTPADELTELAQARDEAWTDYWGGQIESGDVETRAISIDGGRQDALVAVLITLTEAPEQTGDSLARAFAQRYGSGGVPIGESCGVRANGADGAYVEHTIPRSMIGGGTDRTQLQFLIPDRANNALWGVTCDVPKALASDVKARCVEIAATFQPLPPIEG